MTVYCKSCGSPLADGAHFCEKCGSPVDSSYIQSPAPLPPPSPSYSAPAPGSAVPPPNYPPSVFAPPPQAPTGRSPCLVAVIVAVAVLLLLVVLGVCGYIVFFPGSQTSSSAGQTGISQQQETEIALNATQQVLQVTRQNLPGAVPTLTQPPVKPTLPPPSPQPVASQPPASQTQSPSAHPQPTPAVNTNGISFSLPVGFSYKISSETVPAYTSSESGLAPGMVHPEFIQFSFSSYPLSGTLQSPQIMVYPAPQYSQVDELAGQQVKDLTQLLQSKPAQSSKDLPFLPLRPAAQMMSVKIKYLNFQNGSGVRFLTQFGQAEFPINNEGLFYTFQGLTSDGKYYIAAVLPVSNPILPDKADLPKGDDFNKWIENYQNYKTDILKQLESRPEDSFNPKLNALDAMIQSLKVK